MLPYLNPLGGRKLIAQDIVPQLIHAQTAILIRARLMMRERRLVSEAIENIGGEALGAGLERARGRDGVAGVGGAREEDEDAYNLEKMSFQ